MNELDLTAPSILSLFDTTKAQRLSFADKVAEAIDEGRIDPLKLKIQLKAMEDIICRISDNERIKDAIATEAAKYGKGSHDFHNATFQLKATAGRYDYSADGVHANLKEQIKAREAFLKTLKEPLQQVTPDGEVVIIEPAKYTPGADVVFVMLK